jgi:hypothetical protein
VDRELSQKDLGYGVRKAIVIHEPIVVPSHVHLVVVVDAVIIHEETMLTLLQSCHWSAPSGHSH